MIIANPIYDVVFKYLMDEGDIARRFISKILDVEILTLELRPTERTQTIEEALEEKLDITIYRLDFIGEIKTPNGPKKIMIELQKAWDEEDVHRFRNYLAQEYARHFPAYKNYLNELKSYRKEVKKAKDKNQLLPKYPDNNIPKAIPIVTIYIINHELTHDRMLVHAEPVYKDPNNNNEILKGKDDFIENLIHNAYFIQIPHIPDNPETELEKIFSVFNQHYLMENDKTKLDYLTNLENIDNVLLKDMLQVLRKISSNPKIAKEIENRESGKDYLESVLLREFAKQAKIEYESQQDRLKADEEIKVLENENIKAKNDKKKLENDKKKLEDDKINMIIQMNQNKLDINMIATYSQLSINEIEQILNNNK